MIRSILARDALLQKVAHIAQGLSPETAASDEGSPGLTDVVVVRVEHLANAMRYVASVAAAILVPLMYPAQTTRMYGVILFWVVYATVLSTIIIPRRPVWLRGGYLTYTLDVAFVAAAIGFTGGMASLFTIIYLPLLAFHSLRFGRLQLIFGPVVTALALAAAVVASGDSLRDHAGSLAFYLFWIAMLAFVITLVVERGRLAEARLATELRRTQALHAAAQAASASLALGDVLRSIVQEACSLTGADGGVVQLYDKARTFATQSSQPGGEPERALAKLVRSNFKARSRILAQGQPLTPADLSECLTATDREALGSLGSLVGRVIPGRSGRLGCVVVARVRWRPAFDATETENLEGLLTTAALSIENARLHQDLRERMEQLTRMQGRLIQREKLATVGELAARVAHEMNNPLTGVLMYNSILIEDAGNDEQRIQELKVVEQQALRARDVVRNLLEFTRAGQSTAEPQKSPVDVTEVVRQSLQLLGQTFPWDHVQVVERYPAEPPMTLGDANEFKQVFLNLFRNALQAMPHGGTLTITVEDTPENVRVSVADTGTGISPNDLEQIFTPFFTTKPPEQGTGLGLAISRDIIRKHGGGINVVSQLDRGSVFTVTLPHAEPRVATEKVRLLSHG